MALGQRGGGERGGPADRRGGQRLAEPRPAALDQFEPGEGQLAVGSRGNLQLDEVAGDHHRAQLSPAPAGDIAGDHADARSAAAR